MKRILVADDEMDIVRSVQEMLSPYYIVDTATTGVEILRLCAATCYDGLIIDADFGPLALDDFDVIPPVGRQVRHAEGLGGRFD